MIKQTGSYFLVLIILFLGINICSAQNIQASTSQDTIQNPCIIPSDGNFKAHIRWNIRCAERVGSMAGKPCDLLFIGDSITQNFSEDVNGDWNVGDGIVLHFQPNEYAFDLTGRAVWTKYYHHRNALDFGVGADGTEHILWRMNNMDIRQFQPKVIIILAGTNDINYQPQQIAMGIRAVVNKALQMFPSAHVLLMSLTPRTTHFETVVAVNQIIQTYADNNRVFYIDLFSRMVSQGSPWLGIGHDGLHLTTEGYELWAKTIAPSLEKFAPVSK